MSVSFAELLWRRFAESILSVSCVGGLFIAFGLKDLSSKKMRDDVSNLGCQKSLNKLNRAFMRDVKPLMAPICLALFQPVRFVFSEVDRKAGWSRDRQADRH